MMFLITTCLPWVLSMVTITAIWLTGNKDIRGWYLSLFNQVLWTAFIFSTHSWGLLPTVIVLTGVNIRNIRKWRTIE